MTSKITLSLTNEEAGLVSLALRMRAKGYEDACDKGGKQPDLAAQWRMHAKTLRGVAERLPQ